MHQENGKRIKLGYCKKNDVINNEFPELSKHIKEMSVKVSGRNIGE